MNHLEKRIVTIIDTAVGIGILWAIISNCIKHNWQTAFAWVFCFIYYVPSCIEAYQRRRQITYSPSKAMRAHIKKLESLNTAEEN